MRHMRADLLAAIDRRLAVAPHLQALAALLDRRGPVMTAPAQQRRSTAVPCLKVLTDHLGRAYDVVDKDGDFVRKASFWPAYQVLAAEAELGDALEAAHAL
eukprot:TRINITY_DN4383_c0_g1_i4.p2 TRINITY_DN4383_c0_g1~~TRINITY_DN4383_c0_g1_i4.p2  ORF type:complete len:101 (-),score=14.53 TRINITY_DN4383_c0_g1_i4:132-434(-)